MPALSISSRSSTHDSPSSPNYVPASPASIGSNHSGSSSKVSFDLADEENMTITTNRQPKRLEKDSSLDDIRLLAISTHMTELSYAISDIQTRIFEIQELRHKSQTASGDTANTSTVIDQSLMSLDERLESVEKGIKTINDTLEPLLRTAATPTVAENGTSGGAPNEEAAILRKHATLLSEWESVQDETEILREELKEDKWLTVFRTVTDQADGMMSSLEKAVNRCQDFIWQVHRRGHDELQSNAAVGSRSERLSINLEVFTTLLESYEAKKKHYMPATSKVLSIIDKGVRDRVTKNGETLRRHAESAQRWKSLRDRISRTDAEMESVRRLLAAADTDHESTTSGTTSTKNGYLATPPNGSRTSRTASSASITLSRSISPFRKIARKLTRTTSSNATSPLQVNKNKPLPTPASEPPLSAVSASSMRRQRASLFSTTRNATPQTPERPSHKYSQSYTPDSSPHGPKVEKLDLNSISTSKSGSSSTSKQRWNSSTKIGDDERNATIRITPKRPPSSSGFYGCKDDVPPVPSVGTPYRRSLSRASMASSRPWSPLMSSNSTTQSSAQHHPPVPALRTPSRSQTPSRATTPSFGNNPRIRPKTPSHTPGAPRTLRSISTPGGSSAAGMGLGSPDSDGGFLPHNSPHPARPPSRSMIPVPSVHLQSSSRPGSSMSSYASPSRAESPTVMLSNFRNAALRAQTPEVTLRSRAQQVGIYQGSLSASSSTGGRVRPSLPKLPPSSFREASSSGSAAGGGPSTGGTTSRTPSRPSSRAGAHTPSSENLPLHEYIPGNPFDPLDVEVGKVVNSLAHGLLVERVDPPLKRGQIPKEGEEIKAQYAFSNSLSRKVVTCRLTTLSRSNGKSVAGDAATPQVTTTKKVMCRVGGGWQDLSHYILNRQAGLS